MLQNWLESITNDSHSQKPSTSITTNNVACKLAAMKGNCQLIEQENFVIPQTVWKVSSHSSYLAQKYYSTQICQSAIVQI